MDEYLAKEVKLGAIFCPFDNIQCAEYHFSHLLTRPKEAGIILDLSHPHGASVKDQVHRELFDNHSSLLRFRTIDDMVQEITKDSVDKCIFKIDIRGAFHNLRVEPADAFKFFIQWMQKS